MGARAGVARSRTVSGRPATVAVLALLALLALCSSIALAAKPKPIFWKNFGDPVSIEPTRIDINYSTGFAWATKLTEWEDWGTVSATATGVIHLNTCRPYCAAGNYKSHRARITLFKVRHCDGQRRYLDIKVQPKGLPLATWGSDCRGAQVAAP